MTIDDMGWQAYGVLSSHYFQYVAINSDTLLLAYISAFGEALIYFGTGGAPVIRS